VLARLRAHHQAIRAGLSPHKSPAVHGAFPIDPYSHTPAHAGAQQPGLTGQVKEDIIARLGELGVVIERGVLRFCPRLLRRSELSPVPGRFDYLDVSGRRQRLDLPEDSLAFTFCQVPVIYRSGQPPRLVITRSDDTTRNLSGSSLDAELSRALFDRSGEIRQIEAWVTLAAD
jgi:hypothetical protein